MADNTSGVDGDGVVVQFRDNVLWAATNAIRTPIRDALGAVEPAPTENPVATIGAGLGESAVRFVEGAALAPLGLIPIAQAIANGDKEDLYLAIRQYIDAPLWVADPTIDAVVDVVDTETGAEINRFRDETLWGATFRTREIVADTLGVDVHHRRPVAHVTDECRRRMPSRRRRQDGRCGQPGARHRQPGQVRAGFQPPVRKRAASRRDRRDRWPRGGRAAVRAFNDHVKASAERFNQRVRKLAGGDDGESNTEGGTTAGGGTTEGDSTTG